MARRGLLSAMARPKRAHVDVDRTKIANRRSRRRDTCNPLNAVSLFAASKRDQRGCRDLITIPSVNCELSLSLSPDRKQSCMSTSAAGDLGAANPSHYSGAKKLAIVAARGVLLVPLATDRREPSR